MEYNTNLSRCKAILDVMRNSEKFGKLWDDNLLFLEVDDSEENLR